VASADLSNGDFSSQMTAFNKDAAISTRVLSANSTGVWYTSSTDYTVGNWACRWKTDETNQWATSAANGYSKGFMQFIAMPGEGTYTLSLDYMMNQLPAWARNITVYALNESAALGDTGFSTNSTGGGARVQLFSEAAIPLATSWTNYSNTFTIDATAAALPYLGIRIQADGDSAWLIDNASIVPEPATMSLLGLGALALIRRRR
jgi:hypothetical protein